MNTHTIKSDTRRSIKFEGELIASNTKESDEELCASIRPYRDNLLMRLSLYRTKSGKAILAVNRFSIEEDWENETDKYVSGNDYEVFDSVEDYIDSVTSEKKIGRFTYDLVTDLLEKHPEYEDIWVEEID